MPVRDPAGLPDILCIEQSRVVARDNTVSYEGRSLQLPQSPARAHYVKANVTVREYPDGTLAVFHGPRRLARYSTEGEEIAEVPPIASVTPCLPPSRRGLARAELVGATERRPALTAPAHGVTGARQVGTKKRSSGRTKKLTRKRVEARQPQRHEPNLAGASTASKPARSTATPKRTNDVLQKPDNSKSYRQIAVSQTTVFTASRNRRGQLPEQLRWRVSERFHGQPPPADAYFLPRYWNRVAPTRTDRRSFALCTIPCSYRLVSVEVMPAVKTAIAMIDAIIQPMATTRPGSVPAHSGLRLPASSRWRTTRNR